MRPLVLALLVAPWGFQCPDTTHAYGADVDVVRVAWAEDTALPIDACGEPAVATQTFACDAACSAGFRVGNTLLINADLDEATTRAAVRHEAVHWLAWCTGYQVNGDPGHADRALWNGVFVRAEEMSQ